MFEGWAKTPNGIKGYFATFFSLRKKSTDMNAPKTIRQITFGDDQGKITPPKSSPSKSISVRPRMHRLPRKSIALSPSTTFVLGLWTSRKKRSRKKVSPEIGRLIQKHPVALLALFPGKHEYKPTSPRHLLREYTPKNRAYTTSKSPHELHQSNEESARPH